MIISPNKQALSLIQNIIAKRELLKIEVYTKKNVTLIDCGVKASGGWEAGVFFASICMGGLAQVELTWTDFAGLHWPGVKVVTDHPLHACLAAQYAGWPVKAGGCSAMVSGPGRAIVHEGRIFKEYGFRDKSEIAVFCMESETLPTEEVIEIILEACPVKLNHMFILTAPTASQAGSIQIAARAMETGLSKLLELDYDLSKIISGWGICPVAPVAVNTQCAVGRTNDALLYGSTVFLTLKDDDKTLAELVNRIPAQSSKDYGRPFEEILKCYGDFYNIDRLLFSPAEVWLCNLDSGQTFHAGVINGDILKASFH